MRCLAAKMLTNVQFGKPYELQSYIDNRDSDKTGSLKSINYWVGWHNVLGEQYIAIKNKKIKLENGLYNFKDLKEIFSKESIDLSVNKNNVIASLEIPVGTEIELTSGTLSLLGIVSKHCRLPAGQHVGLNWLILPNLKNFVLT